MGLKSMYDSVDEVPEAMKDFYKDENGHFVLDVEDIDAHPKVRGVVTANRENVKKRDQYKAKVAELEGKLAELPEDFNIEEYLALKATSGDLKDPDAKKKQDEFLQSQRAIYEKRIEKLTAAHAAALAAKDAEINERDGFIDKTVVIGGLKDALLSVGTDPELLDGALASLRDLVKVQRNDDGSRKAVVETDLGPSDVTSFVKDWAGTKGKAYLRKPTGPSPAGSNGRFPAGTKTMKRSEFDQLDPVAKQKTIITDKITVVD